jgi:hypothetical protein
VLAAVLFIVASRNYQADLRRADSIAEVEGACLA